VHVEHRVGAVELPRLDDGVEQRADRERADEAEADAEVDAEDRRQPLVRRHRVEDEHDDPDRAGREDEAEDRREPEVAGQAAFARDAQDGHGDQEHHEEQPHDEQQQPLRPLFLLDPDRGEVVP
ncbi:MAG: hypothetical protein ACK55I_34055, partial [bacterium]